MAIIDVHCEGALVEIPLHLRESYQHANRMDDWDLPTDDCTVVDTKAALIAALVAVGQERCKIILQRATGVTIFRLDYASETKTQTGFRRLYPDEIQTRLAAFAKRVRAIPERELLA